MQLKELKLSGFKSFVEPTAVAFPSQLVGVVGPNGCGKSNIIDAVRWVMGESSAKNLRGEAMVDVIFNGSSNRRPVGQASVEIIFDNSLGRLTGQYASYQEISIKRVVTRDGDSNYFLNGARCRRRDITDIFLGTGAGARGYAIIGQDMISRLIEARPDDLKAYLEEAAGISKYKERRRETLQRITQTRENLARIADIREELSKQLNRLEKQAKAAERFKILKENERQLKGEILTYKWQTLNNQQIELTKNLNELNYCAEEYETTSHLLAKEETIFQNELQKANTLVQEQQNKFYKLGTDIARLEEAIQQQRKEKELLHKNIESLTLEYQSTNEKIADEQKQLLHSEDSLKQFDEKLVELKNAYQKRKKLSEEKEQRSSQLNNEWLSIQEKLNSIYREKQANSLAIKNLQTQREQYLVRLEKITHEKNALPLEGIEENLSRLEKEKDRLESEINELTEKLQCLLETSTELQIQINQNDHQLNTAQDKLKQIAAEKAALDAAQAQAMKKINDPQKFKQWSSFPRVISQLKVDDKWRFACEFVLGDSLQAIVVEHWDKVLPSLAEIKDSAFFVTAKSLAPNGFTPRLIDKITGPIPTVESINEVYLAETLSEAIAMLDQLQKSQSVITPEGVWLGQGWVKIASHDQQEESLLVRHDQLQKVSLELECTKNTISSLQIERDKLKADLCLHKTEEESLTKALRLLQTNTLTLASQITNKKHELNNILLKGNTLQEEKEEKEYQLEIIAAEIEKLNALALEIDQSVQQLEERHKVFNQEKLKEEAAHLEERKILESLQAELHQQELQRERDISRKQQLQENLNREKLRIVNINNHLQELKKQTAELSSPDKENEKRLEEKLHEYQELEHQLSLSRSEIQCSEEKLQLVLQKTKELNAQAKNLMEKIQQNKLDEQVVQTKKTSLEESLLELNLKPIDGFIEVDIASHEKLLIETQEKIKRLGAINLIAIEEYQEENNRKQQLDSQYTDLTEALTTLELAIAKMDKETQTRLRDTFDQINSCFQALFPRLFGGGRAMLELTCDNLLEAGVLVMAQPPGKRNSTIQMLSGGEKAMTAVALVFAIFQLNPSPFCMLDEVDAPLDDINVRRFCDLVKEMSEFVQFLFITHNKVTMELADHLIGVTMREPGVSRVVAVDVEQALAIAE